MAYSEQAIELRRCTGTNKDGTPCQAWALWPAPDQCCRKHTTWAYATGSSKAPVCRCMAYQWPHRPGGGLCRWPEDPKQVSKTPAGKHKRRPRRGAPVVTVTSFSYVAGRDSIEKLDELLAMLSSDQKEQKEGRTHRTREIEQNDLARSKRTRARRKTQ